VRRRKTLPATTLEPEVPARDDTKPWADNGLRGTVSIVAAPASTATESTAPPLPLSRPHGGAAPVVCCRDCGRFVPHLPDDGWGECPHPRVQMPVPARAPRCRDGFLPREPQRFHFAPSVEATIARDRELYTKA